MALIDLSKLWCKDDQIEALKKENEKLNKWLDLKSEYIAKLEAENKKLRAMCDFYWGDLGEYMWKESNEDD